MKAIIFCAGLGTRLKPLTDTMPKALVPINGKPLLQWQVEKLRDAGIKDIVVNVHHFSDQIIEAIRVNNGWGCNISVSDERDALLDTGGGLRKAKELLLPTNDSASPFLACNVDILSNINIKTFIKEYSKSPSLGLLVVSPRETQRYLLFDKENTLRGWTNIATGEVRPESLSPKDGFSTFDYKQAGLKPLAFSGMQILSPAIFDHMEAVIAEKGAKFSLIDLYLSICKEEVLKAFVPKNYKMMDVGKINQLEDARFFSEKL
ncbi:MAG: nucleotidyltransferase family protein [Paludibacteraceae bacterium]|nr:nucleotidyltransferase family protein [Paludibacteraceae bacterium]